MSYDLRLIKVKDNENNKIYNEIVDNNGDIDDYLFEKKCYFGRDI